MALPTDLSALLSDQASLFSGIVDEPVRIHVDADGKVWWRLSDVLHAFDLPNVADSLACLVGETDNAPGGGPVLSSITVESPEGMTRDVCVASELGVMLLARRSRKARTWVQQYGAGAWPQT